MTGDEILVEPEKGEADSFRFSFTTQDGKITGRVSVKIEGGPDTRSKHDKMRAAQHKIEHLSRGLSLAASENQFVPA